MSRTLIGIVTYGNLPFTKLTIEEIEKTTTKPYDFLIIVGKPGDTQTIEYLKSKDIPHIIHNANYGFPYSLNDLYEHAFAISDYDNLIIVGNDVIAYPTTIDSMIEVADTTDYVWISAVQYDVRNLVKDFPDAAQYFSGSEDYIFNKFDTRPWDIFQGWKEDKYTAAPGLSDIHNLALYKKAVFDTIGYVDVNFYPAYYSDNDYARRGVNSHLINVSCTLNNAYYFHFWSRTIKQESGGSNSKFFQENQKFYKKKWHGDFGKEQWTIPFNGKDHKFLKDVFLPGSLKIESRADEDKIINYWANKK